MTTTGILISTTQSSQVTGQYEYDCRDQLRRVLAGSGQELAAYDYDFERHRLAKTVGASALKYVYGGNQVINEHNSSNQLENRYDLGADEVVRAELGGEGSRHYFGDGLNSVTALAQQNTATTSSLTATYEYDAWGNYFNTSGASNNSIGYTGQRVDGETGLMPLGNGERYYSPALGSFIQQDSLTGRLEVPPSLNRYPLVGDLANEIEALYPDHVVGVNIGLRDAAGQLLTDVDIWTKNAVIQVKSGKSAQNILKQLQKSEAVTGLPAVGYAPNLPRNSLRTLSEQGALVTNDREVLLEIIKP
jgi:RHS repeat-associated protein